MTVKGDISLREYLRLQARRAKDPPCIDAYDEFLIEVWDFFSLRVAAEQHYEANRHVAHSRHGALPVSWALLRDTWSKSGPPEQAITVIAKRTYGDVNALIGNLRKVLNRVRQKVAIARVQQVDSHCLRWLTRQPGRSAAEKGGSRQEILGVVRVENYDTLENRVLKDFLSRCVALSTMYLRRYDTEAFHGHVNVKAVARFRNLCIGGLQERKLEAVSELREIPQPNYVLQQDRLYSKVWSSYCDILRQEDVAEKLWSKRERVNELYTRCQNGIPLHCSPKARFCTPLWINPIDGRKEIIENPVWENELGEVDVASPRPPVSSVVTVNFTYPWDARRELVYPIRHPNAQPFLQDPHRPSREPGKVVTVNEILRKRDGKRLQDYSRQLYGLLKGDRWIVLVPDDWEVGWLETVKRAQPSSLNGMFLLWRSVAAALGAMEIREFLEGESLVVADGYVVPSYNAVELRFMQDPKSNRILPQRSSVRLHGNETPNCADVRFRLGRPFGDQDSVRRLGGASAFRLGTGLLSSSNFLPSSPTFEYSEEDALLQAGVNRFVREEAQGLVSYFDERDALFLVVQNSREEVEFKTLVEHDERSPGGQPYRGAPTKGGTLQMGATELKLYLLEGEPRDDAPLKDMVVKLDEKATASSDISYEASMTPGQGLASVLFKVDCIDKPILLDLRELRDSEYTKSRIEREMKRHFPPVMPLVEASEAIWRTIAESVRNYLNGWSIPPPGAFAQAQPYWGEVDPTGKTSYRKFGESRDFDESTMSPIDRLKRENVFGNSPEHRTPRDANVDWTALFDRLAKDYKLAKDYNRSGKNVLRLIAWSYQYDAPCFEFMREDFHERYVKQSGDLDTMEITFCANCFPPDDSRVEDLLREVLSRIGKGQYKQGELRLAYNLMQFHPESMGGVPSDTCEKAMNRLAYDYNRYPFQPHGMWGGGESTKAAGYYLKCMLFILHRRRFAPSFLRRDEDWTPTGFLGESLPTHTETLRNHECTRKAFIEYVRGRGTIDGIPLGD